MKKRLFCILLCAVLLAVSAIPVLAEESYNRFGDLDNDGKTNAEDYMMLKRYVLGTYDLSQKGWYRADVNYDGKVDAKDYFILKREVLGTYNSPSYTIDFDEASDGQIYGYIHKQLGRDRPEGLGKVTFTGENTELAAETMESHGLTRGEGVGTYTIKNEYTFEGVAYVSVSFTCQESEIRELLFALLRDERVFSAGPESYLVPD